MDSVLASFDGQQALPRLGGMARPDGVAIVSERFWAFAGIDGTLREGRMPSPRERLRKVPLLRGLARLGLSLSPLFRRDGVAKPRERLLLVVAVAAPLMFAFLPHRASLIAGLALTLALVVWLLRGRTLALHGAEHRAIAAAEERRLAETWRGAAQPTRFAARCGTNFAVLVFPVAIALQRIWPFAPTVYASAAVVLLSLALTMELWLAVEASSRRLARAFLLPGLGLQRVTTREPRLEETRVALRAVESVLSRELSP
ncbi:MAG: DUF1385 domain-containing protein [Actinobacteria bacterium]|nr:MAG: DUF1385 domain-containing protein [Actinomycetota bacterium]TMM27270.1 MAG: DUF1385 domain-containing protein [Actinomycetota bacterium]